jgi:selenide,water dikinase
MQCAGCGAKLGHEVLRRALARLESVARPDVLIGLDAPDDAAVVELPPGMLAVHSVDIFPALVADPFVAGEIAAVHCLSDIYAMGASPHTALAIVTLPHGQPGMQEDTLTDLLAGALSVLMPEHTALVGGHTLEGDRLEFGLSVNGVIPRDRLLNSSAPLPGDRLILTKPLGIGAIFAADMRGQARPDWTAAAIEVMKQSNAAAARILFDHGATACTDVTGFGLAGHLLQLLRKFNVSAAIELDTIPVLSEAIRASRAGIRSTLYPANLASERDMESNDGVHARETYPLLFDPQTSGGLLAAVPSGRAGACAAELRGAGYDHAADIGFIEPASGRDRVLRLT